MSEPDKKTDATEVGDIASTYSVLVNSRNKLSGTDADMHFQIQLPLNHKFNRVCVKNAIIPKSYYIVPAGFNTFQLQEAKGTVTVTVPAGNYTRSSFMKALQALLNAASPGALTYSITYPSTTAAADTGLFTYSVTGGTASFIIGAFLFEQLGFNANTTVALPTTSTNVLKFVEEDSLVLHSDIVDVFEKNILCVFMVGVDPPFSSTKYECRDIKMNARKLARGTSNAFRFTLTDEDENVMDLNGLNWVFELVFFTE